MNGFRDFYELKLRLNKIVKKRYFACALIPIPMVNILVPTDFSDLSKVAINFAIKVANKLDGNVTLLHVVNMIQPARASMRFKFKSLEQELVDIAEEDFAELIKGVTKINKTTHPIKFKIVRGSSFNDTLKREAKRLRSGLIIMGTRGASGLKKVVVGSSTASIIEISHIPVLAIPELAEFKNFKNIVYATDLKHLDRELKALLPYAKYFDSTVHMLHVAKNNKNLHKIEEKMAKAAVGKIEYNKFTVKAVVNKDIDDAIEKYVKDIKADLLTTFAHDHNFYEKLFNRSVTRKLAFQSVVPLLAFK